MDFHEFSHFYRQGRKQQHFHRPEKYLWTRKVFLLKKYLKKKKNRLKKQVIKFWLFSYKSTIQFCDSCYFYRGDFSITVWKVFKYRVLSGPYFPALGLNTEIYLENYGPEKTPYLDTFHTVKQIWNPTYPCPNKKLTRLKNYWKSLSRLTWL